jgi:hypothetical protein
VSTDETAPAHVAHADEARRLLKQITNSNGNIADIGEYTGDVLALARVHVGLANYEVGVAALAAQQAAAGLDPEPGSDRDMYMQLLDALNKGTAELARTLDAEPGVDVLALANEEIQRLRKALRSGAVSP